MRRVIFRAAAVPPVMVLRGLIALAGPSGPAAAASVATVTLSLGTPHQTAAGL